jgi:hypothetical protein
VFAEPPTAADGAAVDLTIFNGAVVFKR